MPATKDYPAATEVVDALRAAIASLEDEKPEGVTVQGHAHLAVPGDPLGHLDAPAPRHERLRIPQEEVVDVVAGDVG